ncbi:MAG: ThuA protein [Propionibacteriaceae bacterium]|nr:ThuA protein [Propionibacteriaceae bacterium]
MPDVHVVSGGGPYADQWHRFPATSARIARIVENLGLSVDITEEVERGIAEPGACRLLIVNIGNPADPPA